MKQLLVLSILLFHVIPLCATGQGGDRIIVGKDTLELLATPLEKLLSERKISPRDLWGDKYTGWNTGCWRGYVATWKIENNKLFLEEIAPCDYYDYPKGTYPKAYISKLFPDLYKDGHIFASWITDELLVANGKRLWYMHSGFDRIYAHELGIVIENGILQKTNEYDNSKTKESPLLNNERLLLNTIYSNIRWNEIRSEIDETRKRVLCTIVSADDNGKIDSVRVVRGASEKLNQEAVRAIKLIPQWEVLYKKGKRTSRLWTMPVYFDLKTMEKYSH